MPKLTRCSSKQRIYLQLHCPIITQLSSLLQHSLMCCSAEFPQLLSMLWSLLDMHCGAYGFHQRQQIHLLCVSFSVTEILI